MHLFLKEINKNNNNKVLERIIIICSIQKCKIPVKNIFNLERKFCEKIMK